MSNAELELQFQQRLRYKRAPKWQKPLVDPARFVRNQMLKRADVSNRIGELRVVPTFHCPTFTVVTGENVSEEIASYGIYEAELSRAFLRLVQPGQVVVDIGMHIGYFTTLFACLVGAQGQVHAFEPTPSTREIAQRNVALFPQVKVHPFAVWSRVEELEFRDYGVKWMSFNSFREARLEQGEAPKPKTFRVQTITLDAFRAELGRPIALAKIDAESAELEILRGARAWLAQDRPILTMEVGDAPGESSSRQLLAFLEGLEYVAWELGRDRFVRHQPRATYSYDNLVLTHRSRDLARD